MWDIWIVEKSAAKILIRNVTNKQWMKLQSRIESRLLFRVPVGFVLACCDVVNDGL